MLGISDRTLLNWLAAGIVLPPAFEDDSRVIKLRGVTHAAKYYLHREGKAVKSILDRYGKKKSDLFPPEMIEQIHGGKRRGNDIPFNSSI
jgi:hypothetical protein